MKTRMKRPPRYYDLLLAAFATILLCISVYLGNLAIIQRILFLANLFTVGYLLLATLYPSPDELSWLEKSAGGLAVGVTLISLLGLTLNQTPLGIGAWTYASCLVGITLILVAIAYYRRWQLSQKETEKTTPTAPNPIFRRLNRWPLVAGMIISAILLVALFYVALFPPPQQTLPTTQFYLESASGGLEDLTFQSRNGQPITVKLGVSNLENKPMEYHVYQYIDGEPDMQQIATLELEVGQKLEVSHTLSSEQFTGETRKVYFLLYQANNLNTPYRTLYIWLRP